MQCNNGDDLFVVWWLILSKLVEHWWTIFIVFYLIFSTYISSWKTSYYSLNFIRINSFNQSFIIVDSGIIWQSSRICLIPFEDFKFIEFPSESSINFDLIREKNNSTCASSGEYWGRNAVYHFSYFSKFNQSREWWVDELSKMTSIWE